ncbi:MAG: phage terminase large subunit family protein [Proteobacteria bacterium]|nr:phage terminase large subunit family protein [Pseudomonadota bacterium]
MRTILRKTRSRFAPPPKLTISQWADQYCFLPENNAEPGRWRTSRAPYQKEIMDAICDRRIEKVTVMTSAQVGKTSILNNAIGYYIHQNPKSIIIMHPTLKDAKDWSTFKLAPIVANTPVLRDKVAKPRARDKTNTTLRKEYPGGYLMILGSNSTSEMRGRSAPIILCDEVDAYEITSEGDAINLLWKRANTFKERKLVLTSTPTIKDISRIDQSWENSDKRRYHIPCPHCGKLQWLKWACLKWDKSPDGKHLPETAYYECEHCKQKIYHGDKNKIMSQGKWISENAFKAHAGFHLNELISPWRSWQEVVEDFLEKKAQNDLQVFFNAAMGEPWEEKGEKVDGNNIYLRREYYGPDLPEQAVVLTAGVDVQDDRLECEIVAWGPGEESWSMDYVILRGDPSQNLLWSKLSQVLARSFKHPSGSALGIEGTAIDTGGHYTQEVYRYCRNHPYKVYAIKGNNTPGGPLVSRPSKSNLGKVNLFGVNTVTAKDLIYSRLNLGEPGPGYCHFPVKEMYSIEYFHQLTVEKRVLRYKQGRPYHTYIKPSGERNEALDCRVYALSALYIVNPNMGPLKKKRLKQITRESKEGYTRESRINFK